VYESDAMFSTSTGFYVTILIWTYDDEVTVQNQTLHTVLLIKFV